jgi:hypothetical protein
MNQLHKNISFKLKILSTQSVAKLATCSSKHVNRIPVLKCFIDIESTYRITVRPSHHSTHAFSQTSRHQQESSLYLSLSKHVKNTYSLKRWWLFCLDTRRRGENTYNCQHRHWLLKLCATFACCYHRSCKLCHATYYTVKIYAGRECEQEYRSVSTIKCINHSFVKAQQIWIVR